MIHPGEARQSATENRVFNQLERQANEVDYELKNLEALCISLRGPCGSGSPTSVISAAEPWAH